MNLLDITPNKVVAGTEGKHFMFYGDPSTRKTSVAACFPNSLLLATEIGYSLIPNVTAFNIDSWATFKQVLKELEKDEVKEHYKAIILDSVGLLSDLCVQYICNINGVKDLSGLPYGQGWSKYKVEFQRAINHIAQMGYSIVFIAHAEEKKNDNGDVIRVEPRIDRRAKETVEALTDFIFYVQKEVVQDNETVMAYCNLPEGYVTKTRLRNLNPRFEFTYDNLLKEINIALNQYENIYGVKTVNETPKEEVQTEEQKMQEFEEIRNHCYEVAKQLLEDPIKQEDAQSIIVSALKGVRISEAPYEYKQKLQDITAALLSL